LNKKKKYKILKWCPVSQLSHFSYFLFMIVSIQVVMMNSKNAIVILFFIFFYKLLLYNEIKIFFSFFRVIDLITWDNVKFNSWHERKLRYNKQQASKWAAQPDGPVQPARPNLSHWFLY
jgi:hypothetical protein